jgi:hypothetical protein
LGLFDVLLEELDGKHWIKLIVASGSEKPYYVRKQGMSPRGCFIRIGSAAEPMPERMIEQLFATRTRNSIGRITAPRQKTEKGSFRNCCSRQGEFGGDTHREGEKTGLGRKPVHAI